MLLKWQCRIRKFERRSFGRNHDPFECCAGCRSSVPVVDGCRLRTTAFIHASYRRDNGERPPHMGPVRDGRREDGRSSRGQRRAGSVAAVARGRANAAVISGCASLRRGDRARFAVGCAAIDLRRSASDLLDGHAARARCGCG